MGEFTLWGVSVPFGYAQGTLAAPREFWERWLRPGNLAVPRERWLSAAEASIATFLRLDGRL